MSVIARSTQNLQVEITAGKHSFLADEPLGTGDDTGPTPYDLFLAALGACTVMTLEMYARRKDWPLKGVEVGLNTFKEYAADCENCENDPNARIDVIEREILFHGDLAEAQIQRLLEIADKCPIHRTMTGQIQVRTTVARE